MSEHLRGTVHIRVQEKISVDQLQSLVAKIAGMSGCLHCGLLGVDLRLTGDPVEATQISGWPGVKSVTVGA